MFSAVIKDLRLSKGMTQKQLAQAVYLSPSAISQYENGTARPCHETLDSLAQYFDVSVSYLLGTSVNAEIEKRLSEEFCNGISLSEVLNICTTIAPENRPAFLKMASSLSSSDGPSLPHKNEKVCR